MAQDKQAVERRVVMALTDKLDPIGNLRDEYEQAYAEAVAAIGHWMWLWMAQGYDSNEASSLVSRPGAILRVYRAAKERGSHYG